MDGLIYLSWLVCTLLCGWLANRKNRSIAGGMLVGFMFGVIGVIVYAVSKPLPAPGQPAAGAAG